MDDILILNIGGTFNKTYNLVNGKLEIKKNNNIINSIFKEVFKFNKPPKIKGMIYKDSLFMNSKDRKKIVTFLLKSDYKKIIIVHGTDTIDKSAKKIAKEIKNKIIVLTGAMKPYSINKTEATSNLMMSYGFIQNAKDGVYICLNGVVDKYNRIVKDRKKGYFLKVN